MARTIRRHLECDCLESRTLLSVAHGHIKVHAHAHSHAHASKAGPVAVAQATPGGAVTGGGLINVGPAPTSGDIQALQQATETNNLVMFLSQLEYLKGTNASIQQGAGSILNDARNLDLMMWNTASTLGVNVPSDIEGSDKATAKQVALAANSGSLDQAALSALSQAGATLIGQLQQMQSGAQAASLRTLAQTALPIVRADVAGATAAASGTGSAGLTPAGTTPISSTLSSSDLTTLEQSYSSTVTEHFLAQLTALLTTNSNVETYAEKLISDHEQEDVQTGMYAAATGTYLPASIQGQDVSTAMKVVDAVKSGKSSRRYDTTYLKTMVQSHSTDIANNEATISSTQNPVLKEYATDDIPTDFLHRLGAQTILKQHG